MEIKEIRKRIRGCKNIDEFYALREHLENRGVELMVRRWNCYEMIDSKNCNIYFEDDGSVHIQLPPAWSINYKNINCFSYNVKMRKGRKPSFKSHHYKNKLKEKNEN